MPSRVTVREIFDEDLDDVHHFCSTNFNFEIPLYIWRSAFAFSRLWMPEKPNNGFMLVENKTIVGISCVLYSQQQTQKTIHHVCNLAGSFILKSYRTHSLRLIAAILSQKEFLFTTLSVGPEYIEMHRRLKWGENVTTLIAIPNLPKLNFFSKRLKTLTDPESISRCLDSHIRKISIDHSDIPMVRQIVFRTSNETLLIIFDNPTVRRVPVTNILYLSNPDMFYQNRMEICSYFLLHNRTLLTRIHRCSMSKVPKFSLKIKSDISFFYIGDFAELPFPEFIYSEYLFFCRQRYDSVQNC